jgi:hypothetical protein
VGRDSLLFPNVNAGVIIGEAVMCPDGKRPLGGGFEPLIAGSSGLPPTTGNGSVVFFNLVSSAPVTSGTSHGWAVTLRNGSGTPRSNVQFRVWAVCVVQP